MHNLAYKIEPAHETVAAENALNNNEHSGTCAACGERLFSDNAPEVLWQAWSAFWEISSANHAELVCGACGEYLQNIFNG